MSLGIVGQRCVSEREPELGLGSVAEVDAGRITVAFPAAGERRIYARGTSVLQRVEFHPGDTVLPRQGVAFVVETVRDEAGLLVYAGGGRETREDALSDSTNVSSPVDRLLSGQADPSSVFDLRRRTLAAQARIRQSEVRGFLGGRIDLIPHQFFILHEVARREVHRVLLADEVGLGKTIEACLILQRLLTTGQASRALVLVPEPLVHQWFVELLRRFNLWFTLLDEERCVAIESGSPGANPFLSSQLVLSSVEWLTGQETRGTQAVEAGWDLVIVDEAHHLGWTPEAASPEYALVERLAEGAPGLLLLTATPTQLGLPGHFARLRLLDPHRYADYQTFVNETADFGRVAGIADKLLEEKSLTARDHETLRTIFQRDPEGLERHLGALREGEPGAAAALLGTMLDQHGTGRVVFRNTRASMTGFPKRQYCPAPIADPTPTQLSRVAREIVAEETGELEGLRYSFREDPRLDWLVGFLKAQRKAKVLLICRSERKVLALEAALKERINLNVGLFHEGLPLVQRDRQAAWFAEPDGARLLICSEIGSEGRNFQFAHHLVLFDLPLNPALVEQRIGRLDRIGQSQTIRIHVPVLAGGVDEAVANWYHEGVDAFGTPLHGGNDYVQVFRDRLLAGVSAADPAAIARLLPETAKFRVELNRRLRQGRDRLLELNSFSAPVAATVIEQVRAADQDSLLRRILADLFDHFGVRVREHEEGDVHLDADHAYVEGFPSIPREGMLATYDRARAVVREDIQFLSADHPLVADTLDLMVDSATGTTAFCVLEGDQPNVLLEAVFVLETLVESRWHVDRFLAPTPMRVLVDVHGRDLSDDADRARIAEDVEDAPLPPFLARPEFNATLLRNLVATATTAATTRSQALKEDARQRAAAVLTAELQRLVDLSRYNDHVRPAEIDLARKRVRQTRTAIEQARLRLDSLRLIVEGLD